jgi:dihydrofolate synthase/folylpolyglutamate synthase
MDEYTSIVQRLYSLERNPSENVDDIRRFAKELGLQADKIPVIHVTGSNGKGSVCFKIAKALELSGYKTGLYTSPHIHCFTERITISSLNIEKEQVVKELSYLLTEAEKKKCCFSPFTLTTLLALHYFQKQNIDVAVVEVGIGGRLDATRVFHPILSIITSVSLEHTALLGNTREEIAKEKAGICASGIPLVLGPKAYVETAVDHAKALGCPIISVEKAGEGGFDVENASIASISCQQLQKHFIKLTAENIQKACSFRPSCRKERIGPFIFDVAHNPVAIERLLKEVKKEDKNKKIQVIIGMSSDKDVQSCLSIIADYAWRVFLVQATGVRPIPAVAMLDILHTKGYKRAVCCDSIADAIMGAFKKKDAVSVVCGSFYIMDSAKRAAYSLI